MLWAFASRSLVLVSCAVEIDDKVVEWPGGDDEREAGSGDSSVGAAEAERKAAQRQAKVTVVIGVV
jgi:hypothetical protein